jgi:hypothetical protein
MISVSYTVMTLGQCISPAAILGEISKVAVNAVNCGAGWSLTHICKKILKFQPPLTDSDAFGSIGIKLFIFGISASREHGLPSDPRWCSAHAMLGYGTSMLLSSVAAAGGRWVLCLKSIAANFCCISTITLTHPAQVLAWCSCALDDQKTFETLTREIVWRDHSHTIMIFEG